MSDLRSRESDPDLAELERRIRTLEIAYSVLLRLIRRRFGDDDVSLAEAADIAVADALHQASAKG